jgi:hypothetical protein
VPVRSQSTSHLLRNLVRSSPTPLQSHRLHTAMGARNTVPCCVQNSGQRVQVPQHPIKHSKLSLAGKIHLHPDVVIYARSPGRPHSDSCRAQDSATVSQSLSTPPPATVTTNSGCAERFPSLGNLGGSHTRMEGSGRDERGRTLLTTITLANSTYPPREAHAHIRELRTHRGASRSDREPGNFTHMQTC